MNQLQAVRYFITLADTLSFKATAQHFGVPSSTVSRAIKALESELGVQLVERTTRRVRLTEVGSWYLGEVVAPVRALDAADALVGERAREATGVLRLTALPGYGEARLFEVLEAFRRAHPRVVCDVEFTDRYLDLSTGEVDVALRATADPPEYMVARRLHSHRFVLVGGTEYLEREGRPRTLVDLQRHPMVVYRGPSGPSPWWVTDASGERAPVVMNPTLITNQGGLMLRAVLAGEGLALLPDWGVVDAIEEGLLEELTLEGAQVTVGSGPSMSMYLLYAPDRARLGKVRVAVDFLARALQA